MSVQRVSCTAHLTQSRGWVGGVTASFGAVGFGNAREWSFVGDDLGEDPHDEAGVTRMVQVPVLLGHSRPELSRSLLAVGKTNREKPLDISSARRTSMLCQKNE